jgi:curved DNA-binding protein
MTDHYNTLGVDRNASPDQIKSAYRKMAAKHHPDRGGDTASFQSVQAAYETLSDPNKRAQYDQPQPQVHQHPGGFHFHSHSGMPGGFEDIFAQFTGGHPFDSFFGNRQPHRNKTLNIQTAINLEDAFHGKDLLASLTLPSGREQTIEVKIPAGIHEGTTLRLSGLGDDSIPNMPRGDLHLTVSVLPHAVFRREGDDLIKDIHINCVEAMLGRKMLIDTLDGKKLEVNVTPGIQPGQILCATGQGMPKMNDNRFRGHLMLNVKISIPKDLTLSQKSLLEQFNQ